MKILIISGSRTYSRYELIYTALEFERKNIRFVFQGGARGADTLAKNSAVLHRIPYFQVDAEWSVYGRDAGPIRNERMLERALALLESDPYKLHDKVELWAFRDDLYAPDPRTGGNGTLDMCARALARGVPARWYSKTLMWRPLRWDERDACVRVGDTEMVEEPPKAPELPRATIPWDESRRHRTR